MSVQKHKTYHHSKAFGGAGYLLCSEVCLLSPFITHSLAGIINITTFLTALNTLKTLTRCLCCSLFPRHNHLRGALSQALLKALGCSSSSGQTTEVIYLL
jgi:hypothetical protein